MKMFRRLLPGSALTLIMMIALAGCRFWDASVSSSGSSPAAGTQGSTVDASGGEGTVGTGGDADSESGIWIENYGPMGIRIESAGIADASFATTLPAATPDLGGEPLTVVSDLSIPVHSDHPAGNGMYYLLAGDSTLYHKVDDATINPVTGIRVNAGATLTFGLNADQSGDGRYDVSSVRLANDVLLLGTVRTAAFADPATQDSGYALDRGGLRLETDGGVFIRPTGLIATAGDNAASGDGGQGGVLIIEARAGTTPNGGLFLNEGRIDASGGSSADPAAPGGNAAFSGRADQSISIRADVLLVNTGTIRASGGDGGTDGGSGPAGWPGVRIESSASLNNTGPLEFNGGAGIGGNGGFGGTVSIMADEGSLRNSGTLTARGGAGRIAGGDGGWIQIQNGGAGNLLNAGDIDAGGGNGTGNDDLEATYGGSAGDISFYGYGGDLVSSGNLSACGGDAMNANPSSRGGNANGITIDSRAGYAGESTVPAGRMEISGNLRARGGRGPDGGYGGWMYIDYADGAGSGGIRLRGCAGIVANGGAGAANGGYGGWIYLYDNSSGGLVNGATASTNGGSGASGGDGGYVDAYSSGTVAHGGAIAADGGNASSSPGSYAGNGGYVNLSSGLPPSTYGAATVRPGTGGDPEGTPSVGGINVDGNDVTPPDGTLP